MASDELARSFFAHWEELEHVVSAAALGGGELKDVFRVACEGGAYALRVYTPEGAPDDVASELALAAGILLCRQGRSSSSLCSE